VPAEESRLTRIARNEASFREINDRLEKDLQKIPYTPERLEFVCECAKRGCETLIELTFDEYRALRADSRRFAVSPGHAIPDVERVVLSSDRYEVVEKTGEGVPVADAADRNAPGDQGRRSADPSP
jgi:hypothetical protein